jgi:hypothetical protein
MHCINDNEEYNTICNIFIASNKSEIQYSTNNDMLCIYNIECISFTAKVICTYDDSIQLLGD